MSEHSSAARMDMAGAMAMISSVQTINIHEIEEYVEEELSTSVAEELIRLVATRIGMNNPLLVDQICENLRLQYIREEWQLSTLDSYQWQQLGAPVGLAVAIQRLVKAVTTTSSNHHSHHHHHNQQQSHASSLAPETTTSLLPSVIRSSGRWDASGLVSASSFQYPRTSTCTAPKTRPSMTSLNGLSASFQLNTSNHNSSHIRSSYLKHSLPVMQMELEDPVLGGDKKKANTIEEKDIEKAQDSTPTLDPTFQDELDDGLPSQDRDASEKIPLGKCDLPECQGTFSSAYRQYSHTKTNERSAMWRAFPVSAVFQQGLLHAKSGPELKAHTVFVMELSILSSALFLGAAVEMWGAFPVDRIGDGPLWIQNFEGDKVQMPFVPRNLAIVYHFVAVCSLMVQLFVTTGWIWALHATAAVSSFKFHQFLLQTRYIFTYFLIFGEIGVLLLTANICLLFGGMVSATTNDPIISQFCLYLPAVLFGMGYLLVHRFSSYIGRVAYHGLLLMDQDPNVVLHQASLPDPSCLKADAPGGYCYNSNPEAFGAAARAEKEMTHAFNNHNILCERSVLDVYHQSTKMYQNEDDDASNATAAEGSHSLFDFIFPSQAITDQQKPPRTVSPPSNGEEGDAQKEKHQ